MAYATLVDIIPAEFAFHNAVSTCCNNNIYDTWLIIFLLLDLSDKEFQLWLCANENIATAYCTLATNDATAGAAKNSEKLD